MSRLRKPVFTAVFFNLFAAGEPPANVCVAHGTLCNDPCVYPTFCYKPVKQWYCRNRIELWWRASPQVISVCFGETPDGHSRNPEVPRNPDWKTLAVAV